MANPVLGKSLCSEWFFLGQDLQYGHSVVEKNKNVIDQPRSVRIGKALCRCPDLEKHSTLSAPHLITIN